MQGSEVYAAPRVLASELKISIHKTGECQMAFHKPYWDSHVKHLVADGDKKDRAAIVWSRKDIPSKGAISIVSLLFASDLLKGSTPREKSPGKVCFFKLAEPGKAAEIRLVMATESPELTKNALIEGLWVPLTYSTLRDGKHLHICGKEIDFEKDEIKGIELKRSRANSLSFVNRDSLEAVTESDHLILDLPIMSDDGTCLRIIELSGIKIHGQAGPSQSKAGPSKN